MVPVSAMVVVVDVTGTEIAPPLGGVLSFRSLRLVVVELSTASVPTTGTVGEDVVPLDHA